MATMTAPYTAAMRLGSGFNSFTQQLCINDAVMKDPTNNITTKSISQDDNIAQSVVYKTSIIDKATDVASAMDINAAFLVKYDSLGVAGSGKFANSSKIKESDVSFMVSVRVVNQIIYDYSLTQFQPISGLSGLSAAQLTDIYGDCFISGFQEGGEFTAVISIRVKDRRKKDEIVARAVVDFTNTKTKTEAESVVTESPSKDGEATKSQVNLKAAGFFSKVGEDILSENETTVTVSWSGGGQSVKRPEDDWTYDTMREAALRFPNLVASTPLRTHAILTKYTALRTFYGSQVISLPTYDKTGPYTNILQDAYLDYKTIQKNLQITASEVSEGLKTLTYNPRYTKASSDKESSSAQIKPRVVSAPQSNQPDSDSRDGGKVSEDVGSESPILLAAATVEPGQITPAKKAPVYQTPLKIEDPYEPTLEGLEEARLFVRHQMSRIIQEIDNLAIDPSIATRETYEPPYMSPFLFKRWLPISVKVPTQESIVEQQVVAAKADTTDFAKHFTGITSNK